MSEQQERREARNPIPGQYVATLLDYGISKTKEGKPQVFAVFDFKDSAGHQFQKTWFGSVNAGKARDFTHKALKAMGFQWADQEIGKVARGIDSNELRLDRKVSITVDDQVNQNTGEIVSRINWVNPIGGAAVANRLSEEEAAGLLAMSGIGGGAFGAPPDDKIPF